MSLSLTYLLRHSDEIYRGHNKVANPTDISTTFHRFNLTTAWKFHEALTLQGTLPWVTATRKEVGLPDESYSGLADASLSLLWTPWTENEALSGLMFSLGLILPTGEASDQPIVGVATPAVFQAGTGAFQGTLGLRYSKTVADWNLGIQLSSSFALHESDENFRPATTYYGSLSAGHPLTETLSAKLALDLFHGTRDQLDGQDIPFTGSTTLSLKPALIWQISDQFSASASVSLPIWRRVNTTQLATGPLWSLGMSYNF